MEPKYFGFYVWLPNLSSPLCQNTVLRACKLGPFGIILCSRFFFVLKFLLLLLWSVSFLPTESCPNVDCICCDSNGTGNWWVLFTKHSADKLWLLMKEFSVVFILLNWKLCFHKKLLNGHSWKNQYLQVFNLLKNLTWKPNFYCKILMLCS